MLNLMILVEDSIFGSLYQNSQTVLVRCGKNSNVEKTSRIIWDILPDNLCLGYA